MKYCLHLDACRILAWHDDDSNNNDDDDDGDYEDEGLLLTSHCGLEQTRIET